jgi:hypothetical protein
VAAAGPPPPPLRTPADTVQLWADYAKDRFDSASKRVDEFRNWARQLIAAIAVVIGIELTLAGKVLDLKPPFDVPLRNACLLVFLGAVVLQAILLFWALHTGYVGRRTIGPESPTVLADYVLAMNPEETRQVIGAYYATAYDEFYNLSEKLGQNVSRATRSFAWSIALPLAGFGLFVELAWSPRTESYNQPVMATPSKVTPQPAPTPKTPPAPTPQPPVDRSPAPKPANPLLVKPTPGQPLTEDFKGKIHHG